MNNKNKMQEEKELREIKKVINDWKKCIATKEPGAMDYEVLAKQLQSHRLKWLEGIMPKKKRIISREGLFTRRQKEKFNQCRQQTLENAKQELKRRAKG